nr:hypothetical protein [Tanacetum cinerariifolium]
MSSKEECERMKRKGLKLDQGSAKKMKTSEDVSEEDLKGMMQLVPMEEKIIMLGGHTAVYQFFVEMLKRFDREDLHQLWALVKETLSIRQATKDKEKELRVELKRLFEPDFEDQLWTYNQNLMHDPLNWKLYDTCGVHHVFTKDQEIFMLVESINGGELVNVPWHVAKFLYDKAKGVQIKSKIVGAHLIRRIARHLGLMSPVTLRVVTRGQETQLLDVAKLGELGIVRFNGLRQAEIVDNKLDDTVICHVCTIVSYESYMIKGEELESIFHHF